MKKYGTVTVVLVWIVEWLATVSLLVGVTIAVFLACL